MSWRKQRRESLESLSLRCCSTQQRLTEKELAIVGPQCWVSKVVVGIRTNSDSIGDLPWINEAIDEDLKSTVRWFVYA